MHHEIQHEPQHEAHYEMEELIPIVAYLTEKYTSGESTSITYERASQFMEAVIYCIREYEEYEHSANDNDEKYDRENSLEETENISAFDAYRTGYDRVVLKAKKAQKQYNQMVMLFRDYGNENYSDTVLKGIPAFFKLYDPRFAPQENIITMDYPILYRMRNVSGIDAIEKYIACIDLEQQFMGAFPEGYVRRVLTGYQENYRKQFYNLCSIFLRHILGNILIGKKLGKDPDKADYDILKGIVDGQTRDQLKTVLDAAIIQMVSEKWHGSQAMAKYLSLDIDDFVTELMLGAENNTLEKIVVL
ncbi:MAG: DUF6179 domain-containing protein [Wujia sp.]